MIASPTAYQADPDAFGRNPVGAGPFMVDSHLRDSTLKLVRNPNYWDQPKPYLDAVEFRILPDPLTRAQAVTARETDISANAPSVQAAVLRADSDDLKVFTTVESGAHAVVANRLYAVGGAGGGSVVWRVECVRRSGRGRGCGSCRRWCSRSLGV